MTTETDKPESLASHVMGGLAMMAIAIIMGSLIFGLMVTDGLDQIAKSIAASPAWATTYTPSVTGETYTLPFKKGEDYSCPMGTETKVICDK